MLLTLAAPPHAGTRRAVFETSPELLAQFVFSKYRFPLGNRYRVTVEIGYVRLLSIQWIQSIMAWIVMRAVEQNLARFGGGQQVLIFDPMNTEISDNQRRTAARLLENGEFTRLAAHCGLGSTA